MATKKLKKGILSPEDLPYVVDEVLYVRNNLTAKLIHTSRDEVSLEVGPSHSDENTQVLPIEIAKAPGFQKLWRRGDVTVSSDPKWAYEIVDKETYVHPGVLSPDEVLEATPGSNDFTIKETLGGVGIDFEMGEDNA